MKVISRNSLGGNASILLVDIEGVDGVVRRLLLGTGGNATPTLVTDLGVTCSPTALDETSSVPEAPVRFKAAVATPMTAPIKAEVKAETVLPEAEYDDHDYAPEGVEPGSDPLQTRLRRVHRHRHPGAPSVVGKTIRATGQTDNWRVSQFGSEGAEMPETPNHLESFAAKNVAERATSAAHGAPSPRLSRHEAVGRDDPKRLDVSNAFEAELRRRVYDSSPGERKARSDAARELVDKMIQERMGEARTA